MAFRARLSEPRRIPKRRVSARLLADQHDRQPDVVGNAKVALQGGARRRVGLGQALLRAAPPVPQWGGLGRHELEIRLDARAEQLWPVRGPPAEPRAVAEEPSWELLAQPLVLQPEPRARLGERQRLALPRRAHGLAPVLRASPGAAEQRQGEPQEKHPQERQASAVLLPRVLLASPPQE
jgi:hypothetical protein